MEDFSINKRSLNSKDLLPGNRRRFMNQFVAASLGSAIPTLSLQSREIRPRIALALGTGSIHGIVHIGVLKACEQHGFKPDLITGTSAGAIVGALWASGLRSSSLKRMAEQVGWWDVASFPSSLTGLVSNLQLAQLVERETKGKRIEELPIPFCAVATDLATGRRALLSEGAIGKAVAASCAMPVLFEPVEVGGRYLVDGALTEPVPVQAARDLDDLGIARTYAHANYSALKHICVFLSHTAFGFGQRTYKKQSLHLTSYRELDGPMRLLQNGLQTPLLCRIDA